jgi:hypothetical protein
MTALPSSGADRLARGAEVPARRSGVLGGGGAQAVVLFPKVGTRSLGLRVRLPRRLKNAHYVLG